MRATVIGPPLFGAKHVLVAMTSGGLLPLEFTLVILALARQRETEKRIPEYPKEDGFEDYLAKWRRVNFIA